MKKISSFLFVLLLMLASFTAGVEYQRGDVDHDGRVNINDVTTLIDYLLTGQWPEDELPQAETFTVGGVSFTMVAVEGGIFTMGATAEQGSEANDNEKPAHVVSLSSFAIGQTEVTQDLWLAVMGSNPSRFKGDLNRPVECISWDDCQTFITKLNELTGKTFRLPTEAEWEYAARGGSMSQGYKYAGSNYISEVAWYEANSFDVGGSSPDYGTHVVATKAPNELDLYDMSGNVSEWVQDWYGGYSGYSQTNPIGPTDGTQRVSRGGAWCISGATGRGCRVSIRYHSSPSSGGDWNGLRLAL